MKTTVYHVAGYDEYPGCFGTTYDDGTLVVVNLSDSSVDDEYAPGQWTRYEVEAEP